MKKPKRIPKALTPEQTSAIRVAARDLRRGEGQMGPRPDGQVRELIEGMLGTATRIGEALALRKCDVDMAAEPPHVHINGTVIVGMGKGVYRQERPKTHESNRVVAVPVFASEVIRHRLALITGEDAEHLLFYSRNGTPLALNNVRRIFREILKLAGLEGMEITPQCARSSTARARKSCFANGSAET